MAITSLSLAYETSAVMDAIALLEAAHVALAKRHGQRFRDLERKIEAMAEDGEQRLVGEMVQLPTEFGSILLVAQAHPELTALIREARDMGVIA